jgi:RimJ/RimL family protein N-acetyltransferase
MIEQALQTEPGRLSQSSLWERQRDFFLREGAGIWTRNLVPRYITTNPFIARAYAEVVAAYLEDCRESDASREAPAYIVELGAGSGEFAFHFLRHFTKLRPESPGFRYVMTDISQSIIGFWQTHEQLRPFVEAGILDFAEFNACRDRELRLLVSGQVLDRAADGGPQVFIANYVFDSLPQDAFEVRDEKLYECLPEADADALFPVADDCAPHNELIELTYHERPCSPNFYSRDDWDRILCSYRANVRDGAFLFPVGAMQCVETLGELSRGRFMLLVADKGFHNVEAFAGQRRPSLIKHGGCFSLDVNFHALAEQAHHHGARILHRSHDASHLKILAFVYGCDLAGRTEKAFERHVAGFGPDDFYNMMSDATKNVRNMSLEAIISLLRLSHFDPVILVNCYERLVEILPAAHESTQRYFYEAMRVVEEHWFRLDPEQNPDFYLGTLAGAMGKDQDAIDYYQRAQAVCDSAGAEHNLGLSYLMLGDLETAERCFARAYELDEHLKEANLLSEKLKAWSHADGLVVREHLDHPEIILTPLLPCHAEAFYEHATPEILGLTRLPAFQSVEEVRQWIRALTSDARNYSFAITHRVHGLVGVISLLKVGDKAGRFFFWVGGSFTGRGYATASMSRLLRFALDQLALDELFTSVLPHNERSARLLLRLGFYRVQIPGEELHFYCYGVERFSDEDATEHMRRLLGGNAKKIVVKHMRLKET